MLLKLKMITHVLSKSSFLWILQGNLYAGLQAGSYCACGNSYGKHGPSNNCNRHCVADKSTICGGVLANTILDLGMSACFTIYLSSNNFYLES